MMANPVNDNMALWETLRPVDRRFTKPITGKSYRGDSPNPTYVIQKLTEVLGPIGQRWGFTVKFDRIREGKPHQIVVEQMVSKHNESESKSVRYEIIREQYHEVCISFWIVDREGKERSFDAYGGTPLLYMTRKGEWTQDEDAAKKSLTDAYTKAASWLGACADIFLGLFDDKYAGPPSDDPKGGPMKQVSEALPGPQKAAAPQPSASRTTTADTGW